LVEQPAPAEGQPHKHSDAKTALLVVLAVVISAIATFMYHNAQNEKRRVSPSEEGFDLKESTAPAAAPHLKTAAPALKR
jgi:hypothetical protein